MRPTSRREMLASAAAVASFLLACGDDGAPGGASGQGGEGAAGGAGGGCGGDDPFAGAELLETLGFVDDGDLELGVPLNVGWDGRLYTNLSTLSPDALVTPNDSFYVRTRYPDLLDASAPWRIDVDGLVEGPAELALEALLPLVGPRGVHLMECSGNSRKGSFGLLSAAAWGGVRMVDVLELLDIRAEATRVLVSGFDGHSVPSANGHSKPGASWVFTFSELAEAFLATEMNGVALPPDHGAPVRLLVPGWYGCTCIKWVDRITLVDEREPATAQMKEFASRTHQVGVPELAAMFAPATIDHAAMPVRVEQWRVDGAILYRVIGVLWGGSRVTDALSIRFGDGPFTPVTVCPPPSTSETWALWSHAWRPSAPGEYPIRMRVDDPALVTRRLDDDYYLRTVAIDEV
jgi:DMSO/TMAO reductase YedYZ molybdopterin-dependent catalytic subunit